MAPPTCSSIFRARKANIWWFSSPDRSLGSIILVICFTNLREVWGSIRARDHVLLITIEIWNNWCYNSSTLSRIAQFGLHQIINTYSNSNGVCLTFVVGSAINIIWHSSFVCGLNNKTDVRTDVLCTLSNDKYAIVYKWESFYYYY